MSKEGGNRNINTVVETLKISEFKVEKAKEADWDSIVNILKENNIYFWLSESDSYESFCIVKYESQIIACFAIDFEENVGILKSFAVKKKLHGKGIGKHIVNLIPRLCKNLGIQILYAASSEAPDFWRKTIFREIPTNKIQEPKSIKYLEYIKNKLPDEFDNTYFFKLKIY